MGLERRTKIAPQAQIDDYLSQESRGIDKCVMLFVFIRFGQIEESNRSVIVVLLP